MRHVIRVLLASVALVAASATAHAQDKLYSVQKDGSSMTYTLKHPAHTVVGVAKKDVEGKVKLTGGNAQVMVRVAVAAFDSDNSNRDAHAKELIEAAKHPFVELKALADLIKSISQEI